MVNSYNNLQGLRENGFPVLHCHRIQGSGPVASTTNGMVSDSVERLEPIDEGRRNSGVMLRKAAQVSLNDVCFNDAPGPSWLDFHIDSKAVRRRQRPARITPAREIPYANQHMRERRDSPRPRNLRAE